MMKKIVLMIATVLLTAASLAAQTPEATPEPAPERPQKREQGPAEIRRDRARDIRALNEGFLFLLQRYSMMDATLGAQERGKDYGHALWLGMASCVPSVGQFSNEEYLKADALLLGTFLSSQTIQELGAPEQKPRRGVTSKWLEALQGLEWSLQSYAMIDAAYTARTEGDRTYDRAWWIGASSVLPGVGQFINHDWWKGAGILIGHVVLERLTRTFEGIAERETSESAVAPAAGRFSLAPSPEGCLAVYRTSF